MSEKVELNKNVEEKTPFLTKVKAITEQRWFFQILPVVLLILMTLLFSILTNGKITSARNLKIIFQQSLIVATVSTGASFIYASGNVNLAMGATSTLVATIVAMFFNRNTSLIGAIILAIVVGVAIMTISALLSTLLNVRVMFVTIVMMTLLRALQETLLKGGNLGIPYEAVLSLSDSHFSTIAFIVYFVACIIIFHFTKVGRSLKMLGTNDENANQTGIEKGKYILIAFIIAGVGAGLGALMILERAGSISVNTLPGLNTDVMLAIVLGGMSIFGGSRSFAYTGIIGSLTVCLLNQGLLMIGVDSSIVQAIRGIIFLILIMTATQRPKGLPAPEG